MALTTITTTTTTVTTAMYNVHSINAKKCLHTDKHIRRQTVFCFKPPKHLLTEVAQMSNLNVKFGKINESVNNYCINKCLHAWERSSMVNSVQKFFIIS